MNILAIDPGTSCGWAAYRDKLVESGVKEFSLGRGDSPGMRFLRFNAWFSEMVAVVKPSLVVFERPHLRGGYATDLLVGFSTRIQERCAEAGINCEATHSATLKKQAAGSGRADKAAMMRVASRWAGREITDDNEADALCMLSVAMNENGQGK